MKKRAIISVSDKRGIVELAKSLVSFGFEIVSTGGTAEHLMKNGISVISAEKVTGFPECFDGRIKTLHPHIHGGILYDRLNPDHVARAGELGITGIDVVIVNLYPFERVYNDPSSSFEDKIENIDIGGPAMVRASAKNFKNVIILTDPHDYEAFTAMLESSGGQLQGVSLEYRKMLAAKAFSLTNKYDEMISGFLLEREDDIAEEKPNNILPENINITLSKSQALRYGENPHQNAAVYLEKGKEMNLEKLGGKELSYNNYLDINAALKIAGDFDQTVCVAIKHGMPCGVGVSDSSASAYTKAYSCDTESIFGGVVAFNKEVDLECAKELTKIFLEIIIATDFTQDALNELKTKKNLRIIKASMPKEYKDLNNSQSLEVRKITGAYLVQERDGKVEKAQDLKCVTGHNVSEDEKNALIHALTICKHIPSNGITLFKDDRMIGVGAGYTSRVRALKAACENSLFPVEGAVMASDGFFPFADSIEYAASMGIKAIVHPGGSMNDDEVRDMAEKLGISLFVTGTRHFKH